MKIKTVFVLLTTLLALSICPQNVWADDIMVYDDEAEIEVSSQSGLPRIRKAARASATGQWVTFQTSTSARTTQISDYYISPNANSDGSVQVTVRTSITRTADFGYSYFTTTKTLYDNGNECAQIPADWDSMAYPGQTISQQTSFAVRGGGTHHITSQETDFRTGTGTQAGWDFSIEIPFTITATANAGGAINPSGHSLISPGASQSYTISANSGYRILDTVVDGTSQGPKSSYTFSNVSSNHSITANFQKVWSVTFKDGITGETLGTQTIDSGSAALAPDIPKHDGWSPTGWDKDFSNITSDTVITSTYSAVIKVRVPTLLSCQIMADGSVIVPSNYAIENLSVVPVKASSITTNNIPDDASYELYDNIQVVHSWKNGDHDEAGLYISASSTKNLTLNISSVSGDGAWRDLAQKAASGTPQTFCNLHYVFSQAD